MHNLLSTIASILAVPFLFLGSFFSATPTPIPVQSDAVAGATNAIPTTVALFETSLASKISSTATSMTLVSATDKTGTTLASSTYAFIIDEGTASEEMVVADCTGTACNNMTRGVSPITGTTTVASLRHEHRRGASIKITDGPQLLILGRIINGVGTFPNLLSYTSGTDCSPGHATNVLCSGTYLEGYANNVIAGGSPTSTEAMGGKVELGTLAEQASSYDGGVTKPTVLQTKNSTSTCQVVGSYNIVASTTTGKLDKGCFDQTSNYNLTGNNTIASTTITNLIVSNATTTGTNYYGNRLVQTPKFGGTGTDGALSISSGVTTINVGTRSVVELNYTSVSITGTASLVFNSGVSATSTSGVQVIVRSQGDCTITSSSATAVDVRGLGGGMANGRQLGYTSGAVNPGGPGGGSTADSGANIVTGAAGGLGLGGVQLPALSSTTLQVLPGGNGIVGISSGGGGAAGTFGRGGGGLYLECAGAYNFTTGTITAAGQNGGNGGSGGGNPGGSGGGGGGGGNILVRYGSLTANSGTYTVTAGTAGTGGTGTSAGADGSAGGAGSHLEVLNTYFY